MNRSRAALPLLVLTLVLAACSASPPAASPVPTIAPSGSPSLDLAKITATSSPSLVDRSCTDFASSSDAQAFYVEAGGPDQDLHGLDPDRNGNACDEQQLGPASPAAVNSGGTTVPQPVVGQPATPQPTAGPPQSYNSSSGAVDGKSGGADRHSSCESSDETRCDGN
jgi:hypothetical protein